MNTLKLLLQVQNPFPKWYNPSDTYVFHKESPGHSIQRHFQLKGKV